MRIRDVNATVQTTGASGTDPGRELSVSLSAPNGTTALLFDGLSGPMGSINVSIGPVTLDDETFIALGSSNGATTLGIPWAGTAQPERQGLYVMDNGPARGDWTLSVIDPANAQTSLLAFWRLDLLVGKPYRTK